MSFQLSVCTFDLLCNALCYCYRTIDSENDDEVDEELILQCGLISFFHFISCVSVDGFDNITNGYAMAINAKKTSKRKARERNYRTDKKTKIIRYLAGFGII